MLRFFVFCLLYYLKNAYYTMYMLVIIFKCLKMLNKCFKKYLVVILTNQIFIKANFIKLLNIFFKMDS